MLLCVFCYIDFANRPQRYNISRTYANIIRCKYENYTKKVNFYTFVYYFFGELHYFQKKFAYSRKKQYLCELFERAFTNR